MIAALIAAMIAVESGGNPSAVGDGGRALGALQIHAGVIQDVNRRHGTAYSHVDAFDPATAARICRLYLGLYAPSGATPEILARIWNGGPRGHRKPSTLRYWRKVEAQLLRFNPTPGGNHAADPCNFPSE
jgi:soluble lytic murein transglycosylase-like protein